MTDRTTGGSATQPLSHRLLLIVCIPYARFIPLPPRHVGPELRLRRSRAPPYIAPSHTVLFRTR